MRTDNSYLSNCFSNDKQNYEIDYVKMNTSNPESDQNSSIINNDSGYLTNYNQESQICSSSSSSTSTNLSTEDFYPQKPIILSDQLHSNIYFCENAVFDEPKLEGPPILLEDISVDINTLLNPPSKDIGVNFVDKPTIILETSSVVSKLHPNSEPQIFNYNPSHTVPDTRESQPPSLSLMSLNYEHSLNPESSLSSIDSSNNSISQSYISVNYNQNQSLCLPKSETYVGPNVRNCSETFCNLDQENSLNISESSSVSRDFPTRILNQNLPPAPPVEPFEGSNCSKTQESGNLQLDQNSSCSIQNLRFNSPTVSPESPILSQNFAAKYHLKRSSAKKVQQVDSSEVVYQKELSHKSPQNVNNVSESFVVPSSVNIPKFSTPSRVSMDENSCKSDTSSLRSSGEKRTLVFESPKLILNTSDSETSFSSQHNEFPFENLKVREESLNSTISSVLSNSESVAENSSAVKDKIINVTPNKPIIPKNEISPDLFSEEEEDEAETEILPLNPILVNLDSLPQIPKPIVQNEQFLRNDRKLLRRVQESISGVPPPPSVTILQTTVNDMLNKIHANKHLFLTDDILNRNDKTENVSSEKNKVSENNKAAKSLLICNTKDEILDKRWPEVAYYRYHGLHFNRTKVSEDFEFYCMKYQNRYVGVDTASSCTVWSTNLPSSAKKRNARLRWTAKSPGRRLSHLAKRRITFSSSNLQANCSAAALSVIGSSNVATKQFVIDTRKSQSKRKSPWKKSPRKSPLKKIRTPSSSSKKNYNTRRPTIEEPQPGPSRMVSTKRALFQSPEHNRSTTSTSSGYKPRNLFFGSTNSPNKNSPNKVRNSPRLKNSPAKLGKNSPFKNRNSLKSSPKICDIRNSGQIGLKSRRNLFLSPKKSSPQLKNDKKRKREEDGPQNPPKIPRSLSFEVDRKNESSSLQRRHSELSIPTEKTKAELSDLHKKKLLWAVSEALRTQNIGMSNPNFRKFAPILCKIVKYLMPDLFLNGPRIQGSTSDRMLKITRQYVFAVTRGKTFDEILSEIKKNEANAKVVKKPMGYVPPENFQKNILQDKVLNIELNESNKLISPNEKSKCLKNETVENQKARLIKRQILFDDEDPSKNKNLTNR